jgi:hypothetical protein
MVEKKKTEKKEKKQKARGEHKRMSIVVTLTNEMLATAAQNPDVYGPYIGGKSEDSEKVVEEVEALPTPEQLTESADDDEVIEVPKTVFQRNEQGEPIIWDYQFRGFLKSALGAKTEFDVIPVGTHNISKWTYKRVIDKLVFVYPRKIALKVPEGKSMGWCTRPIRVDTPKGPRVALASSETVTEGTTFEVDILMLDSILEPIIRECLDYGQYNALLQWRSGGKGTISWTEKV